MHNSGASRRGIAKMYLGVIAWTETRNASANLKERSAKQSTLRLAPWIASLTLAMTVIVAV